MNTTDADQLSTTFAALADPTRRAIIDRLAEGGEATVTELAEPFPVSVQAISKHLQVLERAGLITRGPHGSTAAVASRRRGAQGRGRLARRSTGGSGRPASTGSTPGCGRATRRGRRSDFEANDDGLAIRRVFDAPREAVWREWTEPERFADWFGAPDGRVPAGDRRHGRQAGRRLAARRCSPAPAGARSGGRASTWRSSSPSASSSRSPTGPTTTPLRRGHRRPPRPRRRPHRDGLPPGQPDDAGAVRARRTGLDRASSTGSPSGSPAAERRRSLRLVFVVQAPPFVGRRLRPARRRVLPLLLAAERRQVEEGPDAAERLDAAALGRVGEEDAVAVAQVDVEREVLGRPARASGSPRRSPCTTGPPSPCVA